MALSEAPIRFRGGHGARRSDDEATPSGRARSAGRWSPPAAAAALRCLRDEALPMEPLPFLKAAAQDQAKWEKLSRAMRRDLSALQYECAWPILEEHLAKRSWESMLRSLRRQAGLCVQPKHLDFQHAPARSPQSFTAWLQPHSAGSARATPAASKRTGPLQHVANWGLDRIPGEGAICFSRAGDRVRLWKQGGGLGIPPVSLARALVHPDVLPTAVASRADHWWLKGPDRYMSVLETCRAFGLADSSPLTRALCDHETPAAAIELAGRGMHAGVAALIVDWIDKRGLLPEYVTYGSSCSGVDFFAEAVNRARPDAWIYAHAAEKNETAVDILCDAWQPEVVYPDATTRAAAEAEPVDLWVCSPECVHFSRRKRGRDAHTVAHGAAHVEAVLGFARLARARVVVIENVSEPDGVGMIDTIASACKAYEWWRQSLDPLTHVGVPVSRDRAFWVGVLRELV